MRDALEPDTRAFLESLPFPAGERLSVAQMRDRESQMQAIVVSKPRVNTDDGVVPSVGHDVSIRVVQPLAWKNGPLPAVVFVHGGGWVVGGKDTHDRLVSEIAHDAEAAVVIRDY
jgi:acetyl esterase